jgi:hypothetical protein
MNSFWRILQTPQNHAPKNILFHVHKITKIFLNAKLDILIVGSEVFTASIMVSVD